MMAVVDPDSTRTMFRFCLRSLALMTSVSLFLWVLDRYSIFLEFRALSLAFSILSLIVFAAALISRQPLGCGSLNNWDESIALSGIAVLARLMARHLA